jgi:23S rRNA (pseudouridine1915-N3)-methyltransferase
MLIKLITLGDKMPKWVNDGYEEYQKRLKQDIQLQLIELPIAKRTKTTNLNTLLSQEAKLIQSKINKSDYIVSLDFRGKQFSTEGFSKHIENWQQYHSSIAFIVGGPDGVDESISAMASEKISLSKMTLPHPLVRVVLAEQIYRAWSYMKGHPYHK